MTADQASSFLEEEDLHAFLDTHGDRIYTYLRVLCRNEDHASEALQKAYVKFLEQVRKGKVRRDTAPQYLQTIAKHDHFSRIRKESREVQLPDETPDHRLHDHGESENLAERLRLILMETVEDPELPAEVALVMRMRFLEGADAEAIRKRTNRSQATVYRLMEKALNVLGESCRKAGLYPEDVGL
ncbi:MAG: sigma-70 family RNA polymerase sigma factor [Spirochaetia bacterium]|nr:sigma-70 family RNA polymerase sigma factor [Spirochaetia bacterium]